MSRYNRLLITLDDAYRNYDFQILANELYQFIWNDFCDWYLEMAKIDFVSSEERAGVLSEVGLPQANPQTEKVLYQIFEGLLRALHPIMPFITEELKNQMPRINGGQPYISIMFANYPAAHPGLIEDNAEQAMTFIMRLIRSIRDVRQTYGLPPTRPLTMKIEASGHERGIIEGHMRYIEKLAKVNAAFATEPHSDGLWHSYKIDQSIVYIPKQFLTDPKAKEKLLERKQSIEKEQFKIKQILDKNGFRTNAPQEKVDALTKQLAEIEIKLSQIDSQIKIFD